MPYSTVAEARERGAAGTDEQVTDAVARATYRVDRYTRWVWEPRAMTVRGDVLPDGSVRTGLPVIAVTAVRLLTRGAPVSYDLAGVAVEGAGSDRLWLGQAEPYLLWRHPTWHARRVEVDGTFGEDMPPEPVREATAVLAAALTSHLGGAGDVNVEGDADLGVPPVVPALAAGESTTGSRSADLLLSPYRHHRLRVT